MKTVAKRILTLIVVFCMACVGLVCTPITGAKAANVDYVETEFGEGKLLITTTFNGKTYYLPTTAATSSGPKATEFTSVSGISEDNLWTVTADGSNYYIQNDAGAYLYTTTSNNGIRVGSSTKNLTWSYDAAENSFQNTGSSRYLGIYNATDWRCYTKVNETNYQESSTSFKFYKVKESAPTEISALNEVSAYMSLSYKYTANTETVDIPSTKEVTDTLNKAWTGVSGTAYTEWSGKTETSSAVYAGQTSAGNEIQLKSSDSTSGIVTTASGGKVTKITVKWNSSTTDGRTLDVYGKNTAYTKATELYNSSTRGTKLGSIKKGTSTELTISGDYKYIGLRSNSGAMYLSSIEIVWETINDGAGGTQEVTTYSNSEFRLKCGVSANINEFKNVDGVTEYGICVKAGDKTAKYTSTAASWATNEENSIVYVIISLGDIINDADKLSAPFTVQAYVVYNGETYYPDNEVNAESVKTYSVASLVAEYNRLGYAVEHLHNYLNSNS